MTKKLIWQGKMPYEARVVATESAHARGRAVLVVELNKNDTFGDQSWREVSDPSIREVVLSAALLNLHGARWDETLGWVLEEVSS